MSLLEEAHSTIVALLVCNLLQACLTALVIWCNRRKVEGSIKAGPPVGPGNFNHILSTTDGEHECEVIPSSMTCWRCGRSSQ